jgi:hypothetical protein
MSRPYPLPWQRVNRGWVVTYRDVSGAWREHTWCANPKCIREIDVGKGNIAKHGWTHTEKGWMCPQPCKEE